MRIVKAYLFSLRPMYLPPVKTIAAPFLYSLMVGLLLYFDLFYVCLFLLVDFSRL